MKRIFKIKCKPRTCVCGKKYRYEKILIKHRLLCKVYQNSTRGMLDFKKMNYKERADQLFKNIGLKIQLVI